MVGGSTIADAERLRRLIGRIAAAVTLFMLLAAPATFFAISYAGLSVGAQTDANRAADLVSQRILAQPRLWRFEEHRLAGLLATLQQRSAEEDIEIFDAAGTVVASSAVYVGWPHIERVADLREGFEYAGKVVVHASLNPPLRAAGLGFLVGLGFAVLIQFLLRVLPLRAVDEALGRAQHFQEALKTRVDQLEETKTLLQQRSDDLERTAVALAEARDRAQEVSAAKSDFLAGMSHELRTPLNAIIGFSDIISRETFGPVGSVKYREYAADIHKSGVHLLDLINDVLDLSKVEAGRTELHVERIIVRNAVEDAMRLVRTAAVAGGVTLHEDIPSDAPEIYADARKLRQILANLLSNAVKFTDPGGSVTVTALWKPGISYDFAVSDTGVGIAPEDIPVALSQFGQVRGDVEQAVAHSGTGIGLPLTKALVELHGGTFILESVPGQGTTATCRFPAARIALPCAPVAHDSA